ncbi:MAG: Wzt carbohydrate-binding domain-containing protein, partial [Pseudomonadota bacterium]
YEPIKTYSSGMVMRLAFSVAMHAEPKCFLVDEAMAVGDAHFQQKCMLRIRQYREAGGSIVFVSHDMNAVKMICDSAMLLDQGKIIEEGSPDKVINAYNFILAKKGAGEDVYLSSASGSDSSYGNFKARISSVQFTNSQGTESEIFIAGESASVIATISAAADIKNATVGILFRDKYGQDVFGTNTYHLHKPFLLTAGSLHKVVFSFAQFNLGPGMYTLTVAVHSEDVHVHDCYHWVDNVKSFEVVGSTDFTFIGLAKLTPEVRIEAS